LARPKDDYFESYGQTGRSYTRAMARSVVNCRNILKAWDRLVRRHFGADAVERYRIDSFLDVGAATGRLVEQFARVCPVAMGVECASWPRAHLPRHLAGRMLWGDFVACSGLWADGSFDLVFDSSAMYADSLRESRRCLAEVRRICGKGALVYYYDMADCTPAEVARYDRYARVLPPREDWLEMLWRAGFDVVHPWTFTGRYCYDVIFGLKRL
jgi:hypothetical protein